MILDSRNEGNNNADPNGKNQLGVGWMRVCTEQK